MKLSTLVLLSAIWPADVLAHPIHQFKRPLPTSTTETASYITPQNPVPVLEPHSPTHTEVSSALVTRASDALANTTPESSHHLVPRKANIIPLTHVIIAGIAWLVWHFRLKKYTDVAQRDLSADLSSAGPATTAAGEFLSLTTKPVIAVHEKEGENNFGERKVKGEPKGFNDWFWSTIGSVGKLLPGGS
jgi:hypothetical protein